ncbi:MAG TPA: hypothetical protein DCY35_10525 [Prolixibacteraceae bacterium]|nr:hypothetical protein [Prolixibacteraceae bacterium]
MATKNWAFTVNNPYQLYIQHIPEIMANINHITPIEAIVESNAKIASIELFWKYDDDVSYKQITMNQTGLNRYYSEIPVQTSAGLLNYYLRVEDENGIVVTSPETNPITEPFDLKINSENCPIITHMPQTVYGDEPLTIDAVVSDDMGVDEVLLYYRVLGSGTYIMRQMTNGGTGHHYSASVVTDSIVPNILEYYIMASDGINNVTHPVNISVPHKSHYSATFVPGGNLRVSIQQDVNSLNPLSVNDEWSSLVLDRIYDEPTARDPDTEKITPYIAVGSANISGKADSWADCDIGNFGYSPKNIWGGSSTGGEAIVFYDFTNVIWHDNTQMDIRDVMFSYNVAAQIPGWTADVNCLKDDGGGAGSNYSITSWLHIYKVWESADHKRAALKFALQEPYADFFRETLSPVLLPEYIWAYTISGQPVDGAKIWCDPGYTLVAADAWKLAPAQAWDNSNPVGNGLFKFVQRTTGVAIELQTWRDHFFTDGYLYEPFVTDIFGNSLAYQPNIDTLTFKVHLTQESAVLALKNNEIDFIAESINPTFIQELLSETGVAIQQAPEQSFTYLGYNMRRESFGYDVGASFPYSTGDDLGKSFRKAVAHCLDKNRIVQQLLLNYGLPGEDPISSISSWYNKTIPRYSFDPMEAKNILANAGYWVNDGGIYLSGAAATGGAGIGKWWVNPDKSPIGSSVDGLIEILTPEANYDPIMAQTGLMIAQQLRDIGINAQSIAMNFNSLSDRLETRNFDICLSGYRVSTAPPSFLYDYFHSDNALSGQNYVGYQNVSYDNLIDLARSTGDEGVRLKAIRDAQAPLTYDLPSDTLYFRTRVEAYRSDEFIGWNVGPIGSIFNDESLKNIRHPLMVQSTLNVAEKEYGGDLRVALESEPNTINPLAASKNESASKVIDLLYDSLARIDPYSLELVPWIAKDWSVSPDNLTVTVSLRNNVTWHNDSNLTSADVKHTFDTYALPFISSATVIDGLTIEFNLASPDARFFIEAMQLPLFPEGFSSASAENGCGPFKLGEFASGDHITLKCNEDYFNGRANVDSITFTYYPYEEADFSTDYPYSQIFIIDPRWFGTYRASYDIIAGKLDFIGWDLTTSDITCNLEVGGNNTNLLMNSNANVVRNSGMEIQHIGLNTQQSPLNDTFLRTAIAQAVDNDALTMYDISGGLQKTETLISQGNILYWNNSIPDRGDTEYANHLLDEAGYSDRNGDGWRQLPYAPYNEFNISMLGPNWDDVTFYTMSTNIITWLHQIGINASLDSNTSAVNWPKILNDDFDMYFYSVDSGTGPSILNEFAQSGSPSNYANYADSTMDSLLDRMNSEMNESLSNQYAKDCDGYLSQKVPYIPLFHFRVNNAYREGKYLGWVSTLGGIDNFWSYINVYPGFDPTPVNAPKALYAYDPHIGGAINLTWTPNHEGGLTGYNIYRSNVSGGPYGLVESIGLVTSYQDRTVRDQIDYYYVITGLGSESDYSSEVKSRSSDGISPLIVWTSPANGTLDVNISTSISVLFSEAMNQGSVENAFHYTDGTGTWTGANGTFDWTGVDNFTFMPNANLSFNLTFRITIDGGIAEDLAGNSLDGDGDKTGGDDYSWNFITEKKNIDTTAPAPPSNLTIIDTGTGGILNLSWNPNSEPDLAGYKLYRSLTSGTNFTMVADVGLNVTYQDTGLDDGTTYYYVVTAYDCATIPNESNYSNEANGTPTSPVTTGSITGIVLDESGSPIENVGIALDNSTYYCITNANGSFTVSVVPAGNYTLIITCEGYIAQQIDVVVVANEVTEVPDIILHLIEEENQPNYWLPLLVIIIVFAAVVLAVLFIRHKKPPKKGIAQEKSDAVEAEPDTNKSETGADILE